MRIATRTIQVLVALLFIVSGLVKANDPLGLGYKMEEFFELWIPALNAGHFFAKAPLVSLLEFLNHHVITSFFYLKVSRKTNYIFIKLLISLNSSS